MKPRAAQISVNPAGLAVVTGTDVQTAIEELDAASGGGGGGSSVLPRSVTILPALTLDASRVGTWVRQTDSGDLGGGYLYNSSNAVNDEVVFDVLLDAGTWSMLALVDTDSNRGIVTIALDDGSGTYSTLATEDLYGSRVANVERLTTGISVGSAINRQLRLKVGSKNGSSGGYFCVVQAISFRRTA